MPKESFAELLSRFRRRAGLTQEKLSSPELKLSASQIGMLESGQRGRQKRLSRKQLWYLVRQMSLWPPECDLLLQAAGLTTDRSEDEELDIQKDFEMKQMWICARVILDADRDWLRVVADNIADRGIVYRYFTADDDVFHHLVAKLELDKRLSPEMLERQLSCYVLPDEVFSASFAIYSPGEANMYCCGTKTEHGKAVAFYTSSEGTRLYEWLKKWRNRIDGGQDIALQDAIRVHPGPSTQSHFTRKNR